MHSYSIILRVAANAPSLNPLRRCQHSALRVSILPRCPPLTCAAVDHARQVACRASHCASIQHVSHLSGEHPTALSGCSDIVGRRSWPARTSRCHRRCGFYCFVRWLLCWGIAHDSIFPPTYRGLVRNGSSGFSTKKVEFPASLRKREGIFFRPMLFWLEDIQKSPSLPHGVLEILPNKVECS